VAGLACAQLARGLLKDLLFQTPMTDVGAMLAAGGVLIAAAAVACFVPARRAARVPAVEGLKSE
jgi:ABC-type lipoprotein release transport system permease subunit